MKTFKGQILKKVKYIFALISATAVIVLFQNCGPSAFRTQNYQKLHGSEQLSSENPGNQFPEENVPDETLPELADDPQNEIVPDASKVSTTSSSGKVYFVSTSGNNTNPGTISKPFKSIAYAVSKMVAGDKTYVKSGVYTDHVRFGRSGVQLLSMPGESPIIDCQSVGTKMVLIEDNVKSTNPIGNITIEGFEIRNCYYGIRMYNGYNNSIHRNNIHHNLKQGILGNGKNNSVDRNVINHNGDFPMCARNVRACNQMHGMYVTGTNWTITNNLIYDNLGWGIHVAGYQHCPQGGCWGGYQGAKPKIYAGPEYGGASGWLIANNTIAYNNNRAGIILWMGATTNIKILNNIFYENNVKHTGTHGVDFLGSGGGHVIQNNLFYTTAQDVAIASSGAGKYTGTNITANPNFISAGSTISGAPNFKLKAGSPAINKGLTLNTIKLDFLGMLRPRGGAFDIGAFEY